MEMVATDNATDELRLVVKELAEKLVKAPEELLVLARREGNCVQIQVTARHEEIGRLIGAGGGTARALRRIALAIAGKHHLICEINFSVYAELRTGSAA